MKLMSIDNKNTRPHISIYLFVVILLITVLYSCSTNLRGPTVDPELASFGNSFLVDKMGEHYYEQHFRMYETIAHYGENMEIVNFNGDPVEAHLVTYNYWYRYDDPLISDPMQYTINIDTGLLWEQTFRVITTNEQGSFVYSYDFGGTPSALLAPQEITISREQAIEIAMKNGVKTPVHPNLRNYPIMWDNRFRWAIYSADEGPDVFSLLILIDAENANISILTDYIAPNY